MNTDERVKSQPKMLALAGLALSVVSLIVYVNVIEAASPIVFVISTGGALAAGIVSLMLGLAARKRSRQEPQPKSQLLVIVCIVVSIAYLTCIGIVMLNILVQWAL